MRNAGITILALAGLMTAGLQAMQSPDGQAQLQEARRALTGNHKDTDKARGLLLRIVQDKGTAGSPEIIVWSYIYLGYIDDLAKRRDDAVGWYKKAAAVEGAPHAALGVAQFGLQQPLTWLRHLDASGFQPEIAGNAKNPAKAYVTQQPPEGLRPATHLSDKDRRENFEALWKLIDANYAQFKLKPIDWAEVGRRYRARLDSLAGDDDFYLMMFQLVNELKDTHSWLNNYRAPQMARVPDMPIGVFRGKPFVIGGAKTGWEVMSVDGITVDEKIEALRPYLKARSSERAYRREAMQSLLAGKEDTSVTVKLRSPDGKAETIELKRKWGYPAHGPLPKSSFEVTTQRFVDFGRLPSGLGYVHIKSFSGRDEIDNESSMRSTPCAIPRRLFSIFVTIPEATVSFSLRSWRAC